MTTDDDGFLGRWSRRKAESATSGGLKKKRAEVDVPVRGRMITEPLPVPRELADEDGPEESVALQDTHGSKELPADEEQQENGPNIEELERIDIDALDYDADFTKFMAPGVPERLRQRALRRLWGTNPILANVDGLNDYDEDYTDAALAVDSLKTAWKVGQGYLTDEEVEERDAERLAEAAEAESSKRGETLIAEAEPDGERTVTDETESPQTDEEQAVHVAREQEASSEPETSEVQTT